MKNQYYKIYWLEHTTYPQLQKLIKNGVCNFEITNGFVDKELELLEIEFYKFIKAKTDKESTKKAEKFANKKGIEIYSLIKFNTEVITTEKDECDYSVSLTATISARDKYHAIEKFLDTPLDRLNTGENIEAEEEKK